MQWNCALSCKRPKSLFNTIPPMGINQWGPRIWSGWTLTVHSTGCSKIPLRIHQNAIFHVKNSIFFLGRSLASVSHYSTPTKPSASALTEFQPMRCRPCLSLNTLPAHLSQTRRDLSCLHNLFWYPKANKLDVFFSQQQVPVTPKLSCSLVQRFIPFQKFPENLA